MRERVPPPPKLEKKAPKVGGLAAHFACGFFEFWRDGTRSRIVFLEVFARWPLILSDDNIVRGVCYNEHDVPIRITLHETSALGGLPASGMGVLIDFLKSTPTKTNNKHDVPKPNTTRNSRYKGPFRTLAINSFRR